MRYFLAILAFWAVGVSCDELASASEKIIPIGKFIHPSREQITGFTQAVKGREPTESELSRAQEFLKTHPLPPKELRGERRQAVDVFIETTFPGSKVTHPEEDKGMEYLVEQEAIAKIRREQLDEVRNGTQPGSPGGNPAATNALAEARLRALEFENTFGNGGVGSPVPGAVSNASLGAQESPADLVSPTHGHSRASQPEAGDVNPVVISPIVGGVPPVPEAPQLRDSLEKALNENVRTGELSAGESDRALKEMFTDLREKEKPSNSVERSPSEESVPTRPGKKSNVISESSPTIDGIKVADALGFNSGLGKGGPSTVQPVAGSSTANNGNTEAVSGEMSKILSQFGKTSLAPDTGTIGATPGNQTAGVNGSGAITTGNPTTDNSGSSSMGVAKSGGVLILSPKEKLKGWLDGFISSYLKRGRGFGGGLAGRRFVSSPASGGLPVGTLTPIEGASVDFRGEADALAVEDPETEIPSSDENTMPIALSLALGALALRSLWMIKRRSENRTAESKKSVENSIKKSA